MPTAKLKKYINGTGYYLFIWMLIFVSFLTVLLFGGHIMQTAILLPLFISFFTHWIVEAFMDGICIPLFPKSWKEKHVSKSLFGFQLVDRVIPVPAEYYKLRSPKMGRLMAVVLVIVIFPLLPLVALGIFFSDLLTVASAAVEPAQEAVKDGLEWGTGLLKSIGINVSTDDLFSQADKVATFQEFLKTLSSWGKTGVSIGETWLFTFGFTYFWPQASQFIVRVIHDHLTPDWMNVIIDKIFDDTGDLLKKWALGQAIIATILSAMLMVLYQFILGINYGWAIAIVAGVFGFIPFGVTAGAALAIAVAGHQYGFSREFDALLVYGGVLVGTFLVTTFEGKILTPKIQGKQLDIHWAVLILGAVIGLSLGGFAGVFFATPALIAIVAFFKVMDKDVLPMIKRNPEEIQAKKDVLENLKELTRELEEDIADDHVEAAQA